MSERGSRDVERPLRGKRDEIKRRHGAAGAAVKNHHAARTQNVEALLKCGQADGVIDHVYTFAGGQALGLEDNFVRAGIAGQLGFFLSRNRGDHASPQVVRHLREQQAHAARRGMNQRRVAALQRKR